MIKIIIRKIWPPGKIVSVLTCLYLQILQFGQAIKLKFPYDTECHKTDIQNIGEKGHCLNIMS